MLMRKGKVVKDIPANLISDYEKMGWEYVKQETKEKNKENKINEKNIIKDEDKLHPIEK